MFGTYNRLGLPVWATERQVIRAARFKLTRRARWGRECRSERHKFLRQMLAHHVDARKLYADVVMGSI